MANEIKIKRGSGSDPGSSDLSVGELAIRTDTAKLFTKNDAGSVAEIGGGTDATKMPLAGGTFTGDVIFSGTGTSITFDQDTDDFVFADGAKAVFGTGLDFSIFFDGNHARLNTEGNFNVQADKLSFTNKANNEVLADFTANGSVDLYYNNSKKFETTSSGVEVTGNLTVGTATLYSTGNFLLGDNDEIRFGAGEDLRIYHDGTNSVIKDAGTGCLVLNTNCLRVKNAAHTENLIAADENGNVQLYYDNSKKFETTSSGVSVTGEVSTTGHIRVPDNMALIAGTGSDLFIYHTGSVSHIVDNVTNVLRISSDSIALQSGDMSEAYLVGTKNGSVDLYYDNSKKFETTSDGVTLRGTIHRFEGTLRPNNSTGSDIGTTSDRIRDIFVYNDIDIKDEGKVMFGDNDDLQIYHDGVNGSYIDNVTGTADLYIRNTNGNSIYLNPRGSEVGIKINPDAAVELYYDNSKKAETISEGMSMSERLFVGFSSRSSTVDASTSTLAAYGNSSTTTGNVAGSFFGGAVTSQRFVLSFSNNNGIVGSISTHGTQTQFNTTSDYRLKENTNPISDAITRLKILKPLRFNFTSDATRTLDGFLAHEVSEAVPEAVSGEKDGMAGETYYEEGETLPTGKEYGDVKTYSTTKISPQQLDPTKLIPLLTAALQESISKIEILENKVAVLESS